MVSSTEQAQPTAMGSSVAFPFAVVAQEVGEAAGLQNPPTTFAHGPKGCLASRSSGCPAAIQRAIIPRNSAAIRSVFAGKNSNLGFPMLVCGRPRLQRGTGESASCGSSSPRSRCRSWSRCRGPIVAAAHGRTRPRGEQQRLRVGGKPFQERGSDALAVSVETSGFRPPPCQRREPS